VGVVFFVGVASVGGDGGEADELDGRAGRNDDRAAFEMDAEFVAASRLTEHFEKAVGLGDDEDVVSVRLVAELGVAHWLH
jgi:hypothetical protein